VSLSVKAFTLLVRILYIERTAEGLGASGSARITEIGFENEQMAKLLIEAFKYPYIPFVL
jgi:hypothetical protein